MENEIIKCGDCFANYPNGNLHICDPLMKKLVTMSEYKRRKHFSLENLADFIAEFNKDGKYDKTAWKFWEWLDKKCKPK